MSRQRKRSISLNLEDGQKQELLRKLHGSSLGVEPPVEVLVQKKEGPGGRNPIKTTSGASDGRTLGMSKRQSENEKERELQLELAGDNNKDEISSNIAKPRNLETLSTLCLCIRAFVQ